MTQKELQIICDKIQGGFKSETQFPITNRQDKKGFWYYHIISIEGEQYMVDIQRKIIFEDAQL